MDQGILDAINSTVGEHDTLWFLGDFCFARYGREFTTAKSYRDRIRCRNVFMVWGNHDSRCIASCFTDCFERFRLRAHGQKIILDHYAPAVWQGSHRGAWALYGHSHRSAERWLDEHMPERRSLDVGVDNAIHLLGEYRPFSFDEIANIMKDRKGCSIDKHVETE